MNNQNNSYTASASANANATDIYGVVHTSSATANASSLVSYNKAYNLAYKLAYKLATNYLAQQIANSSAVILPENTSNDTTEKNSEMILKELLNILPNSDPFKNLGFTEISLEEASNISSEITYEKPIPEYILLTASKYFDPLLKSIFDEFVSNPKTVQIYSNVFNKNDSGNHSENNTSLKDYDDVVEYTDKFIVSKNFELWLSGNFQWYLNFQIVDYLLDVFYVSYKKTIKNNTLVYKDPNVSTKESENIGSNGYKQYASKSIADILINSTDLSGNILYKNIQPVTSYKFSAIKAVSDGSFYQTRGFNSKNRCYTSTYSTTPGIDITIGAVMATRTYGQKVYYNKNKIINYVYNLVNNKQVTIYTYSDNTYTNLISTKIFYYKAGKKYFSTGVEAFTQQIMQPYWTDSNGNIISYNNNFKIGECKKINPRFKDDIVIEE